MKELPQQVKGIWADCGFSSTEEVLRHTIRMRHLPEGPAFLAARLGGKLFGKLDIHECSALEAVKKGVEPADIFKENEERLRDRIIVTTDISGGIVPMDATLRAWREACGRMNSYLASRADEVWRLFCGIPQRLK